MLFKITRIATICLFEVGPTSEGFFFSFCAIIELGMKDFAIEAPFEFEFKWVDLTWFRQRHRILWRIPDSSNDPATHTHPCAHHQSQLALSLNENRKEVSLLFETLPPFNKQIKVNTRPGNINRWRSLMNGIHLTMSCFVWLRVCNTFINLHLEEREEKNCLCSYESLPSS